MTQKLRIEIMHFKTSMVYMCNSILGHEKRMVINILITTINMAKEAYYVLFLRRFSVRGWDEEVIRRDEVKMACVKLDLGIQINDTEAEVPKLWRL